MSCSVWDRGNSEAVADNIPTHMVYTMIYADSKGLYHRHP